MKLSLYSIPFTFLFILMIGCESKEVNYDMKPATKRMVAYCFFNPDSIWKVNISFMDNVLDSLSSDVWINNASVFLYEDQSLLDTLINLGKGDYISNIGLKPEYKKEYKIKVTCDGYENLTSSFEKLPEPVNIKDIKYYDSLLKDIFPNEIYIIEQNAQFNYSTISILLENALKGQFFNIFLSDENSSERDGIYLSTNSKNDFIEYYSWNCSILEAIHGDEVLIQTPVIPDLQKYIYLYTITESYLLFELSYAEYDFVTNTTYLLSPGNIYSNISGGCGIFAGYTSNRINLKDLF